MKQTEAPPKMRGKAIPNPLPASERSYLRPDEYARRIGVSRRKLDWWMKINVIPYVKIEGVILINPKLADAAIGEMTRDSKRVEVGIE